MTSTPVKDVGALMNYVGSRATISTGIGAESTGGFGDVMNKASGDRQSVSSVKADDVKDAARRETRVDKSHNRPKTTGTENGKAKLKETDADVQKAAEEAGSQLVKDIAEEFSVSEEDVLNAMEELGLSLASLLDAGNLTQLVLAVSGQDSLALLTDGGLYDSLQMLLQNQQELLNGLSAEFSLSEEELRQLLEGMNVGEDMPEDLTAGQMKGADVLAENGEGDEPKISITVDEGTQSVKLSADENGNVKQVETVISKETDGQNEESGAEHKDGHLNGSEEGFSAGNALLNEQMQNKVLAAEMSFEQAAAYMTADTEDIMNQIMDYMKIQIKPGMEQLEMQLHPASLGTVHINLTSKGGELTAQFQVQNEAVRAVIESQIMDLKDALREQGVKVEAVEVMVESHAFEENLWQGQGREENASYQGNRKSPRRINLNSLEDGFEEIADEEEILAAKMMEANGNTVDYTA